MTHDKLVAFTQKAIVNLPQDLKLMLRVVEDPDIEDQNRIECAGAVLHALSSSNVIPGLHGTLAHFDDAILLRLVLERAQNANAEARAAIERFMDDSPELVGRLKEDLELVRGPLAGWAQPLSKALDSLMKFVHHGHNAKACVFDRNEADWLYDAVQEALVNELEFDEEEVVRAAKTIHQFV